MAFLMLATEAAGLAAPSAVGVDRWGAPSIQTPCDADAFATWVRFTNAEIEAYPEPYSNQSNIYANGEVDGLKVRLYTGAEITEKVRTILAQAATEATVAEPKDAPNTGLADVDTPELRAERARKYADGAAAKTADQADDETPAAVPDERWIAEGGYSPDGNAFICPIDACGFGVVGLNSEPGPDDAYAGDPVVEHYTERHPGTQLAVDQAGTVAPIVEETDAEPVRTPKPGDRCRILDGGRIEHWGCDAHGDGVITRDGKVVRRA